VDKLIDITFLDNWIPARVSWQGGSPLIEWCYLGERGFVEPSFNDTVNKCLEMPFNLLFRHQTTMEILRQRNKVKPGLRPTGFIFHLSRSGATLLSRMIAAVPTNIVFSEARPIDSILRAHSFESSATEAQRIEWLRLMTSNLAQTRRGDERHLFIKFDSWGIFELALIRKAFPDVPWTFVYRDPVEVLTSHSQQRGAHMVPGVIDPKLLGLDAKPLTDFEPEEYCAKVLQALYKAALKYAGDGLLINYSQLPEVFSTLTNHFGLTWTNTEMETMLSVTAGHAENSAIAVPPASPTKAKRASERLRAAALRWAYPAYEALEKARLSKLAHD